jgi:hypothetical protein
MFFSYLAKRGITPYRWDFIQLIAAATLILACLVFWPIATSQILLMLSLTLALADLVIFFTEPRREKRKHLWSHLYEIKTYNASRALIEKAEKNILTVEEAKWFLARGLFRNKADLVGGSRIFKEDSISVMEWVAHHGRSDLIAFLVSQGANIARESYAGTPFYVAVERYHGHILNMLFFNKKQFDKRRGYVHTPIQYAVKRGKVNLFEELVLLGALMTEKDKFSALKEAISNDYVDILRCDDNYFSDILSLQELSRNLIHVAAASGATQCMRYLLEKAHPEHCQLVSQQEMTPLDEAYLYETSCYPILQEKGLALSNEEKLTKMRDKRRAILSQFPSMPEHHFSSFKIDEPTPLCGEPDEDFAARRRLA